MGISKYKIYYKGAYYHIYNRGNAKENIFINDMDYSVYLKRLDLYKEKHQVSIICYCLMPNHIHLLIRQNTDKPIYKFIQSLHTSYSMYFNKKYDKVGHIFQGRFMQKNIDYDEYLLHLSRYIHLNPTLGGIVSRVEDYVWSSYGEYINNKPSRRCEKDLILSFFPERSSLTYKTFVESQEPDFLNIKTLIIEE